MGLAAMRLSPLYQLTLAKLRLMIREPEALFWVFVFPLLLALVLGVAFRERPPEVVVVGVVSGPGSQWVEGALAGDARLRAEDLDRSAAARALRSGKVPLVVIPREARSSPDSRPAEPGGATAVPAPGWSYWLDPTRPESRLARLVVDDVLQRAAGRRDPRPATIRKMTEKGSRYIDFLIPGLLGLNLMGTGMWGIGFAIVTARSKHLLKRLIATPMKRSDYLLSQIGGRLVFLVPEVVVLLAFAWFAFGVPIRGSFLLLATATFLGAITFAGLGLAVASRARTVEGVSGLMNFVMMPMWIGSGVFFSITRFPKAIQPALRLLPLTAVIDALRSIMLEGAGWSSVSGELALAAAWAAASFAVALWFFRWD